MELVGNALCLDFVNTVNARPVARRDWFGSVEGAATWAAAVGFDLEVSAVDDDALRVMVERRERLHGVFQPLVSGADPSTGDLAWLGVEYAAAVAAGRWRRGGDRLTVEGPSNGDLSGLFARIADSAVHLLRTGPLSRLGACPACGWLFLDTSKNGRRRWCSMATCGGRDKGRRHYLKTREA